MDAAEYINVMLRDLHGGFRADVAPVTQDQFVHQTSEGANTIAFLFWHSTRWEDRLLHEFAGEDSIWMIGNWAARLGLEPDDVGTGFSLDQMLAYQPAQEDVLAYAEAVWAVSPTLVSSLTPERLDEPLDSARPRMTVGRSIANLVVGHGWLHLGEVRFAKGLMGMPFAR